MNQQRLWRELEAVAGRYRRLRFWTALALAWLVAALVGLFDWWLGSWATGDRWVNAALLCGLASVLAAGGAWLAARLEPERIWLARRVASAYPELGSCLMAAVEQEPVLPDGGFGFLQSSVIEQALRHAAGHAWGDVVPRRRLAAAVMAQFAACALFLLGLCGVLVWPMRPVAASAPGRTQTAAAGDVAVVVEPGNVEIERGTSLLVLARFAGAPPAEAILVAQSAQAEPVRSPMSVSLDDPVFSARIDAVLEPLNYHVSLVGGDTPTYHVTVFEYPRLERADARLNFPRYTGLAERLVPDVRVLTVVEGTEIWLTCRMNKPLASARLVESGSAPATELRPVAGEPLAYAVAIPSDRSRRLKLELVDDAGRRNVQQAEFSIRVNPNQPPTVKPVLPARDVEASPLEELDVRASAWDDFGVLRMGLTFGLVGQPPAEIVLAEQAAGGERREVAQCIRLEDLHAQPDQLLAYHFWAEDFGPDGAVRRVQGDLYFAEVRHFEDIFRQGQPPVGGEQKQSRSPQSESLAGQAAQKLAELQKQIINATWKLIRREIGAQPTAAFPADAREAETAQSAALDQAKALADQPTDPQSQQHLAAVLDNMQRAAADLTRAHSEPSVAPLTPALTAEQAAYQALLKLRSRESEVVRQQRSSRGGSAGAGRSGQRRQQLQQLDLKDEKSRYETQRAAQAQANPSEDRENRQVLNRLTELARRQHDLNERVKDLQSALSAAETPEQREAAHRQLQRLQEEQQQVLRDTEELQSRMDSAENQERMSAERQQVENTREQVRLSSEALRQEQVTRAAAAGTRAERDFEELRNEFRRRAAGRFNDEMQQMREAARDLDRREREIGDRLKNKPAPEGGLKSLRLGDARERVAEELAEQRQRYSKLVEQMRQSIQEAEQSEPLLSERLYEAARNAQNSNIDRALGAAENSVRQGLADDAARQEQAARRGVSELREGIERAAESVLGDEAEALRRARDELRQLSDAINREIARNASAPAGQPGEPAEPGKRAAPGKQGDPADKQPTGHPDSARGGTAGNRPASVQPDAQRGNGQPQRNSRPGRTGQPGSPELGGAPQDTPPTGSTPLETAENANNPNRNPANPQPPGERSPGARTGGRLAQATQPGDQPGRGGSGPEENERNAAPMTGGGFTDFSDRLRDVEEMVADPELRAEAARIRDRARGIRAEYKRHLAPPNWATVREQVAAPLAELANRVAEELLRRNSRQAVVPLDRDPVPPRYSEKTRRYFEDLGGGQ